MEYCVSNAGEEASEKGSISVTICELNCSLNTMESRDRYGKEH